MLSNQFFHNHGNMTVKKATQSTSKQTETEEMKEGKWHVNDDNNDDDDIK